MLRHQLAVLQHRQPRRPKLNCADRAPLATLLGVIPKARRQGLRLLVTPDTILGWHRDIVRRRWAARSACGRTGRPATRRTIRALVRRLARENPDWGYRRIHGELAGLGVKVAASTVWEILKDSGIDPGRRQTGLTWSQFLRSQAEAILACDFFTVDLLDGTQAYVLAAIEHVTRRIRILGITLHPTGEWTAQQARNLLMDLDEPAHRVKSMIRDRGSNFTAAFDAVLAGAWHPDRAVQRSDAPHECDHRTLDRERPTRAPGPRPRMEPGPSPADPERLRDPPQSAPAAPLPARRRATETATRAGPPRPVPRPKTGSRRWHGQRISPGRMTWTRLSARTVCVPRVSAERLHSSHQVVLVCPVAGEVLVSALTSGCRTTRTCRCRGRRSWPGPADIVVRPLHLALAGRWHLLTEPAVDHRQLVPGAGFGLSVLDEVLVEQKQEPAPSFQRAAGHLAVLRQMTRDFREPAIWYQ